MTPEETKAEAFDKIARIKTDDPIKLSIRVEQIISKCERDIDRFWKREARLYEDVISGKNRMMVLHRQWNDFRCEGEPDAPPERRYEKWNPDTQQWEVVE